ncbi:Uncharacterized protein DAT39_022880, partial [Clarias magur]
MKETYGQQRAFRRREASSHRMTQMMVEQSGEETRAEHSWFLRERMLCRATSWVALDFLIYCKQKRIDSDVTLIYQRAPHTLIYSYCM